MTSKNNSAIVAVIPALNESETIASVVDGVLPFASVIVVDDGSRDDTAKLATAHGAIVVIHTENLGYERALSTGFQKAIDLGFKYVITLDADGQHDPRLIDKFHSNLNDGYDLVLGVRNKMQRFGELVFSLFGKIFWGVKDPLCGMKAYSVRCLFDFSDTGFYDSVGTKYMICALAKGYRFSQISITTLDRVGEARFGSGLKPNIKIFYALYRALTYTLRS
jgi:glycosyltransferase involved in cell wall biosynthesis